MLHRSCSSSCRCAEDCFFDQEIPQLLDTVIDFFVAQSRAVRFSLSWRRVSTVAVHRQGDSRCAVWVMCVAGRALCTRTGSLFDPAIRAGTLGACSQAFCHPIRCMLVMVYRQRSSLYTQVRTTTTTPHHHHEAFLSG